MKDRGKRLTLKQEADSAQEAATNSISPQAKSCSILPTLIPEEVQLSKEIDSLTPLSIIRKCSKALQKLEGRYRKSREHLLTTVYAQGLQLMTNKDQYEEFVSDPFWKDRQGEGPKPDDQCNAVRWSVIRALDAKEEEANKAATRDGNAFQQLANEGVQPEDLWTAFKERGGRDTLASKYVASKRPESSKSAQEEQDALTKVVEEMFVSEHVRGPRNFDWDIPNKRLEVTSAFIGVKDGEPLWIPTGVRMVDKSLPHVAPDAVLLQAVKHVPERKDQKSKK
jgi:hypothetical protein